MPVHDIAIVGGGLVGMATALALVRQHRLSLVVLEAENELAAHQSGHNSGVIHSGLYYKPGSEKARNCVAGRDAMFRFCAEHGIAHRRVGKIVVATRPEELPALDDLESRGRANGLTGMSRIGPEQIREYEPHATGIAGLHVAETGIADYKAVLGKYAELVQARGGQIELGARVRRIERRPGELAVITSRGDFLCRHLVTCAGLQSDRVTRLTGLDPGVQIVPFRGEYYELVPERRHLVKSLIYPVPDPRFPFLGVHFTRNIHDEVEAGPNAVLALRREGYSRWSFSPRDTWQLATFGGFWKMASRYWKTGFGELYRSLRTKAFHRALARLLPELKIEDIRWAGSGVRAQAVASSGKLVDDFRIVADGECIHVLNAPSPGATASLSIGQTIAEMAGKRFDLGRPLAG
ncbi:MAG: L-2-hydroxyglutarate oxidase [Planctomycetes bacterium]|nr:L-2-hydroxyglutarate oxidase [Planctomycetota bacterium]